MLKRDVKRLLTNSLIVRDDICVVGGGSETRNGVVTVPPRMSSAPAPAKSDTGRRSGIPADFSEHVVEADTGETVSPPDMAAEKKRGIFSAFRRKKDTKETKPAAVVIFPLRHLIGQGYFFP